MESCGATSSVSSGVDNSGFHQGVVTCPNNNIDRTSIVVRIFFYLFSLFVAIGNLFLVAFGRPASKQEEAAPVAGGTGVENNQDGDALSKKDDDFSSEIWRTASRGRKITQSIARDISTLLSLDSATDADNPSHSFGSSDGSNDATQRRRFANALIQERLELEKPESLRRKIRVHACTWNVDRQQPPEPKKGLYEWLLGKNLTNKIAAYRAALKKEHNFSTDDVPAFPLSEFPDILVVSLQEVEMGGVVLVKEVTETGVAWAECIVDALNKIGEQRVWYRKLKMVQLVGLVLIVVVRVEHAKYVTGIRASLTRTGAMRGVWGNKGSVGLRATIYGKRFLLIAAHFVPHKHNESTRSFNYRASLCHLRFEGPADADDEIDVLRTFDAAAETPDMAYSVIERRSTWERLYRPFRRTTSGASERRVLDRHDYVFFLGDLNSRLHGVKRSDILRLVRRGAYDPLICHDELRQGMVSGDTFDGFQEALITFPPTYKFDRGTDLYDTSRKKRDPAWCDRILFRVLLPCEETDSVAEAAAEAEAAKAKQATRTATACALCNSTRVSCTCRHGASMPHSMPELVLPHASIHGPLLRSRDDIASRYTSTTSNSSESGDMGSGHSDTFLCRAGATSWGAEAAASSVPPAASLTEQKVPTFLSIRRSTCMDRRNITFPTVVNSVNVLGYHHVPVMRQSDHRPVCAQFDVCVLSLRQELVEELLSKVREQIDEEVHDYFDFS
ncbi:inositol 5-phosphatase-like protein [Trypanosoma grayi]|uniref:inositol 5-phosphatase-like protein n=1 Tax=Trypanosoma grayi TaxID=71804 RepID=UPI0004F45EFC|nr:inositol 5-phosphatase-like protein [Trypanosoma grayi]KEG10149.1 inositol 5-phosphatase-like protein [Trypanosoma grayi]